MTKRLAAAVLAAVVNLVGTTLPDAWVADDDDSPDGADVVDLRRLTDLAGRPNVRGAASAACGVPIDGAWAVRYADGTAAAVAVQQHNAEYVAEIDLDVEGSCPAWGGAFDSALAYCHEHHALKVIVHAEGVSPTAVCSVAESRGFIYSRCRTMDGEDVIEFYADLYRRNEDPNVREPVTPLARAESARSTPFTHTAVPSARRTA